MASKANHHPSAARQRFGSDWRAGRITAWLTTVDHKRVGLLYIWTTLGFFAVGGHGDAIAFLVEVVLQECAQGVLVFDHQHIGGHGQPSFLSGSGFTGWGFAAACASLRRGSSL